MTIKLIIKNDLAIYFSFVITNSLLIEYLKARFLIPVIRQSRVFINLNTSEFRFPAANEVKVVLRIKDMNDNSPQFPLNGRPLVAAIPTSANYGYPIARLQVSPSPSLGGNKEYTEKHTW